MTSRGCGPDRTLISPLRTRVANEPRRPGPLDTGFASDPVRHGARGLKQHRTYRRLVPDSSDDAVCATRNGRGAWGEVSLEANACVSACPLDSKAATAQSASLGLLGV